MIAGNVIQLFHQSIEAKMACGEQLAEPVAGAAALIVNRLLEGSKVFCCGHGLSATLAITLTECLANQYRIERPSFPALNLSADEMAAHRLRALAQPGDLLVIFSTGYRVNSGQAPGQANLVQAIQAAHDREMTVLAFTAPEDNDIASLMLSPDIELRVENSDPFRVHEIHLLSLFCLCELIEQQLFGG